jgi:serine protease Do
MRKHVLTSLALLPFLLGFCYAAQNWVDPSEHTMVFSSEDSGGNSYLGVDIADVTSERLSALKLKEEKGVEITMVDQDAPAGKAGLKEHDVILTMNGTSVESAAQLRRMIHETPAGRVVTFGLSRDGQPMTVKVQLGDKQKEYGMVAPKAKEFHFEMPEIPPMPEVDIPSFNMVVVTSSPRSGLTVENITPQLGEFFGVKNGNGVLVRAVAKGSRAEKAGFHAGDVIVKINDQPVHDTSDFTHAVRSRNGSSVNVGVVRDRKEQNISLPLPDRKESGGLDEASLDVTSANAEYAVDLDDLRQEVARVRPEMELADENLRKATEEVRKSVCKYSQEARHEAEQERNEALHEAEQQRREALQEARQQRDELRKEQQQFRDEMRKMQKELRRAWAEI